MANILTNTWSEDTPAGSESRALGDDRIREFKKAVREVIAVDHIMASSGNGDTWGMHNKATFVKQTSDPTAVTDTLILFSKDVGTRPQLHSIDEDGNVVQLTIPLEIKMFGGLISAIPTGWSLCDGTSGRPNLIGKFIRGVNTGATNPGGTGGADSITLAEANLPAHSHTMTHSHTLTCMLTAPLGGSGLSYPSPGSQFGSASTSTSTYSSPTGSAGSGTAFDNRPAYYELAFIIRSA
jgi:microcystin-dependent protein